MLDCPIVTQRTRTLRGLPRVIQFGQCASVHIYAFNSPRIALVGFILVLVLLHRLHLFAVLSINTMHLLKRTP